MNAENCVSEGCDRYRDLLVIIDEFQDFNVILFVSQNISEDTRLNYEQNMHDAIAVFPKLQTGLDVNVRFTG